MIRPGKLFGFFLLIFVLNTCITPQNPLAGIDIPPPTNPDLAYYFFSGARIVLRQQTADLPQARQNLELVITTDQTLLFPEAYPLLIGCYQQLGIADSAAWIYPTAQQLLETHQLAQRYATDFDRWAAEYPKLPTEFTAKDYHLLDSPAEPAGGYMALYRHLEYPEMAKNMNRTGVSYLTFVVEADGSLTNLSVLKSSAPDLDEAALAAVRSTNWEAAVYRQRPVPLQLVIPVVFRL